MKFGSNFQYKMDSSIENNNSNSNSNNNNASGLLPSKCSCSSESLCNGFSIRF